MNDSLGAKSFTGELRPYEKCISKGVNSLTDAELLAVIIKTGTKGIDSIQLAKTILNYSKENQGFLGLINLSILQLMNIKGVGKVKAIQIQCIGELSKRISKSSAYKRLDFNNPSAIADYYMEEMRHSSKEQLIVAMLDTKCRLINDTVLSIGTVNASLITPREVFLEAFKYNAVSIIILHNHPSGDPTPSNNDLMVTKRIKESGEILGIRLIDHIIIGDNKYTSLREKGIM